MAKRFIIQKREIKERHGKKPHLMGPYRTVYSDLVPPFDLDDKDKIEAHLLRTYGEGRYQVKSVGRDEGEKKSKITIFFSGDVERYKPRSKTWTRSERVNAVHAFKQSDQNKAFLLIAFFIIFLFACWAFFASLATGDSALIILAIIGLIAVFGAGMLFIDMAFFETH